jgi:tetratricopeptide (TPR) repeat protein
MTSMKMVRWVLLAALCVGVCGPIAQAQMTSEEYLRNFYSLVEKNDYKTMFRDLMTTRARGKADFSVFQETMTKISAELGPVTGYKLEYVFEDNSYTLNAFYRVQCRVYHQNGDSVERLVIIRREPQWLIDGYVVRAKGKFLFAQGNLYGFDDLNEKMSKDFPEVASAWATLTDQEAYKDTFNNEASRENRKEKYDHAVLLAVDGNFEEAGKIMNELFYLRGKPRNFESPEPVVIKDVLSGKVNKEAGRLYFKALISPKGGDKDADLPKLVATLKEAVKLDPKFVAAHLWLAKCYMYKKLDDKALKSLHRVLAIEPDNFMAHKMLISLYAKTGKIPEAQQEAKKVLQESMKFVPYAQALVEMGFEKKYFDDGKVEFQATFVNGKPNGPYKAYFSDGTVKEEGSYKDGQLDGEGRAYYPGGKVSAEFTYDRGRQVRMKTFGENGEVLQEHTF